MEPKIENIPTKLLAGMRIRTSLAANETKALWKRFKPRAKELNHRIGNEWYSVQIFEPGIDLNEFSPDTEFEKWAAIEVAAADQLPEGMETHTLTGGKYAVFIHKGLFSAFKQTLDFIHKEWLPSSKFELDDREHFEVMDERYLGPDHADSIEEIWVPVKEK